MSTHGGTSRARTPPGNAVPASPTRVAPPPRTPAATPSHHSPALAHALDSIERSIVHEQREQAHIVAPDGRTVFTKKGRKSAVQFTHAELAQMRGNIVTHNHAVEVSFSPADVRIAMQQGVAEMRAVSPGYRYSLRAPEGSKTWPTWDGATKMLYGIYQRGEMTKARSALLAGTMTLDEANATVLHNTWTRMAQSGLFRYERTPWSANTEN